VHSVDIDQSPAPALAVAPSARQLRAGGLARNTLNLVIGQVLTTGLTILLSAATGRAFGPDDFGVLYLVNAVSLFAFVFVDWGHGPYVIREVARHPGRTGELMGTVMALRAATAIALMLPSVAAAWILGYDTRTIIFIPAMMAALMPVYLGLTYGWAFRGHERMEYDSLVNVCLKLLALVFGVTALTAGGRVAGLIISTGVAGAVTLFLASLLYHRLRFPKLQISRTTAKELLVGGAPMVSMTIAIAVQPYIDVNLLRYLAGSAALGWYGAAMTFCNTLIAPAAVLTSAAFPRLSVVHDDPERFGKTLDEGLRPLAFVAALGAVGTYLFAEVAVGIVYSIEQFGPSASVLRAFAPGMFLVFIDMMFGTAIIAMGQAGKVAVFKGVTVVLMSVAEIALIPYFQLHFGNGGLGVMAAFFIGELFMVGADVYLLRRVLTGAIAMDLARALLAGAGTLAVMRTIGHLSPIIGIPACIAIFTGAALAVGLITSRDVQRVAELVRRKG
jgi:O-antigen/teichoic acid export membrane protein